MEDINELREIGRQWVEDDGFAAGGSVVVTTTAGTAPPNVEAPPTTVTAVERAEEVPPSHLREVVEEWRRDDAFGERAVVATTTVAPPPRVATVTVTAGPSAAPVTGAATVAPIPVPEGGALRSSTAERMVELLEEIARVVRGWSERRDDGVPRPGGSRVPVTSGTGRGRRGVRRVDGARRPPMLLPAVNSPSRRSSERQRREWRVETFRQNVETGVLRRGGVRRRAAIRRAVEDRRQFERFMRLAGLYRRRRGERRIDSSETQRDRRFVLTPSGRGSTETGRRSRMTEVSTVVSVAGSSTAAVAERKQETNEVVNVIDSVNDVDNDDAQHVSDVGVFERVNIVPERTVSQLDRRVSVLDRPGTSGVRPPLDFARRRSSSSSSSS